MAVNGRRSDKAPRLFAVPDTDVLEDERPPDCDESVEDDIPDDEGPEEVVDGELVDEDAAAPGTELAIPEGRALLPWHAPAEVQPVIPEWLRDPGERQDAAWWALEKAWHKTRFHTVRTPLYAGRLLRYSPRGLYRAGRGWWDWAFDAEGRPLRLGSVQSGEVGDYVKLTYIRNDRVKLRLSVSGGVAAGAIVASATAMWVWPPFQYALWIIAITLLGFVGRAADKPLIDHAVLPAHVQPITADMVVRAFIAAKLCKDDDPIQFEAPGVYRDGDGWAAVINLPFDQKASEAIKKVEDIAAGLDVDEVRVFVERVRGDAGSARRIALWVANRDPYAAKPPLTPLAEVEKLSLWQAFPFGLDARGVLVTLPLIWSSMLIGSIPRQGKTVAMRTIAMAAALDPFVKCVFFDGKGGKDFKVFELLAHRYGSGVRRAVVEHLVEVLQELVEEMERRYERFQTLPDDVCPDGKITEAISRNKRLDMPLICIFVDEIQRYLQHKEHGKTILELLAELAKVGPAAGIMLIAATQRPDAKVIPEELRANFSVRFALKTMSYQASNVILGPSASKAGLDASTLLRQHKGVGILLGSDDGELAERGAQRVRTHWHDLPVARQIAERGRQLRIDAGTLSGVAAGEVLVQERPVATLLDDILAAFLPGEERLWSEAICSRLAEANPDIYSGWDPTLLANSLKPYDVATAKFWGALPDEPDRKGTTRMGVYREAVIEALAARSGR
jgi:S-DNA-T family DNA segregation ATPase FtsK/SpoIIIE